MYITSNEIKNNSFYNSKIYFYDEEIYILNFEVENSIPVFQMLKINFEIPN